MFKGGETGGGLYRKLDENFPVVFWAIKQDADK